MERTKLLNNTFERIINHERFKNLINLFTLRMTEFGIYDMAELQSFTFIYLADKGKVEEMTDKEINNLIRNIKRDFIRDLLNNKGMKRKKTPPKEVIEVVNVSNGKGAEWKEISRNIEVKEKWIRRDVSVDSLSWLADNESVLKYTFEQENLELEAEACSIMSELTEKELELLLAVAESDSSVELGEKLGVTDSTARKRKERLIKKLKRSNLD